MRFQFWLNLNFQRCHHDIEFVPKCSQQKKQKPVEDVVEDIEQDDAVEGKALLNDDPAYDSPKSIANEPVEIGKQDDAAEGQGLLNDDADDIEAVA